MIKLIYTLLGIILFIVAVCFAIAFPFMWIWNYAVVSAITIANPIDYWQAFWLMLFINLYVASSTRTYNTK